MQAYPRLNHHHGACKPNSKCTLPDRGLSLDSIQEELEDEPLQFKGPMTRARSKRLENQIYSRLLKLQATASGNSKDMKIMAWSTFEG